MDTTGPETSAFISPVAMENDPDALFAGDRGTLDADVRRVLVRILQRRFLLAENSPAEWKLLLEHQQMIESRLNDLFVRLVVDHARGVAYKEQVRSDEVDVPILLKDEAYSRAETLVLVYLRTVFQRETTAGTASARVDVEEVEQTVLTYFSESDGTRASQQRSVRTAIARLDREGIIEEESEGRYRIGPLIEVVLSAETLRELQTWLDEQTRDATTSTPDARAQASTTPQPREPEGVASTSPERPTRSAEKPVERESGVPAPELPEKDLLS